MKNNSQKLNAENIRRSSLRPDLQSKSTKNPTMKRYTLLLAAILMLAALSPLQTRAAVQTWNGAANLLWDTTSANWASPSTWVQGNDAVFNAAGAGAVTLGSDITFGNITINSSRDISSAVQFMTNSAASVITAAAGTSNNLATSIYGTGSLTYTGSGTNVLLGAAAAGDANHYTGGTYVNGGTLILRAVGVNSSTSWAVSDVEAVAAGTTLQLGTLNDGSDLTVGCIGCASNIRPPNHQIKHSSSGGKLNLTGGTYDANGDNNGFNYPPFSGTGTIINTSPYQRGVMKLDRGDGSTFVWAGQLMDGGQTIAKTSGGPGYQVGVDMNGGNFSYIWSGSNSFTGFLRLNSINNKITLTGAGTLGYAAPINCPSRQILMNSGIIDLNGTSQKVGYVYTGNDANSIITNSAFGTTSTLTVCFNTTNLVAFNGAATPRGIRNGLRDDPTVAGTLAVTKEGVAIQPIGTYAADNNVGLNAQCNYHGNTTVNNGILEIVSSTGLSAFSAYALNSPGVLQLDAGVAGNVKQLFVNGAQKANGTYGAVDFPGIITGTGTITVTGSTGVDKVWDGAVDLAWNTTTANWTGSTFNQGEGAVFNGTGPGTVSMTVIENMAFSNLTFNASRNIEAAGAFSTNNNTTIFAAAGTSNNIGLSMYGPGSLTFTGTGTTRLAGDTSVGDGNHYSGGTYVRSGTVILKSPAGTANNTTTAPGHAIDSVEALDTGATLVIDGGWNGITDVGANSTSVRDQIAYTPTSRLNMTGGTLDLNDDKKNQRVPVAEGTGTILNSGAHIQSGLQVLIGSTDKTFAGVIKDGNNGVLSTNNNLNNGPGYQIGIVQLNNGANGSGGVWILTGSNTYSGSTRIDCGTGGVRLAGNGTIGFPSPNGLTGPMRIANGSSFLDLNGRNQTVSLMTDGSTGARILNSAVGTVSTLTVGYGNEQADRSISYLLRDNDGVGGIMAYRKIITAPWTSTLSGGIPATNCYQKLKATCVATYSGDTSVEGGTWWVLGPSAISPNSAYRLYSANYASLRLDYAGNANCSQLWIDGVQQPNGVYGRVGNTAGAIGIPQIDSASNPNGTITVTGFAPATVNAVQSGSNLNLSWAGVYKLQSSTNSVTGPYSDYVGAGLNAATVPINPAVGAMYFRLKTY